MKLGLIALLCALAFVVVSLASVTSNGNEPGICYFKGNIKICGGR